VGGNHQGNQDLGLAEDGNHGDQQKKDRHHSSLEAGYGPGATPSLSQLLTPSATPAEPPRDPVLVSEEAIRSLDLAPLEPWAALSHHDRLMAGAQLQLSYQWPRAEDDPRELSEIAEPRLWTLRADARYPWLPLVIERSSGQLTRHVAMLLPHSFSRSEGIRFAPGALELWLTHRLYTLDDWSRGHQLNCRQSLTQMAAVLGLELDAAFWNDLEQRKKPL
jgi:hypothetical protein